MYEMSKKPKQKVIGKKAIKMSLLHRRKKNAREWLKKLNLKKKSVCVIWKMSITRNKCAQ